MKNIKLIYRPFLEFRRKHFTICAWSGRIKVSENTWLKSEDFIITMGAKIAHGISPEEKVKLKKNQRKT